VLLLLISTDLPRYRPIIWYIAGMNVLLGAMLLAIDLHAGLPALWTALEGPPVLAIGLVIGLLNRSSAPDRASAPVARSGEATDTLIHTSRRW
jgi:hypothetical protein